MWKERQKTIHNLFEVSMSHSLYVFYLQMDKLIILEGKKLITSLLFILKTYYKFVIKGIKYCLVG